MTETVSATADSLADGDLLQDSRVAFVGKLGSMTRKEARELVNRHGGTMVDRVDQSVDLVVIGADQLAFDEYDELLDDWVLEAASDGRLKIVGETTLWQNLGMVEPGLEVDQLYTPAMLAKLLDIPISTVRRWHRRGLISPTRQFSKLAYFDFQEVASARRLARLIASGTAPQAIEAKLSRLAELYPDVQRPLSQLSVIVEGRHVLLRQGQGLLEPSGQMRIDFDSLDDADRNEFTEASHLISFADRQGDALNAHFDSSEIRPGDLLEQYSTPSEFIDLAIECEDNGEPEIAIDVYRSMAMAFGATADVCFRIAELLYQLGDLAGARERYFVAVELDETFVEARANLGCVLGELGQHELAISAFQGALLHHADYPDVHFHLAHLLDQVDRPDDAQPHWQRFLKLAPKSPWADEARQRLGLETGEV